MTTGSGTKKTPGQKYANGTKKTDIRDKIKNDKRDKKNTRDKIKDGIRDKKRHRHKKKRTRDKKNDIGQNKRLNSGQKKRHRDKIKDGIRDKKHFVPRVFFVPFVVFYFVPNVCFFLSRLRIFVPAFFLSRFRLSTLAPKSGSVAVSDKTL